MPRSVYALVLATLVLVALLPPASTLAHPRSAAAPYSVVVEDEWGHELRTFHHGSETYVLGEYGSRYVIRLENRTARRVEAVVSVDGRDAVSGQVGDYVRERGYIVPAYGQVRVEGFRKSLHEVAAFRFTSKGQSYSARMGTPQNVGIIGVAFFAERDAQPYVVRPNEDARRRRSYGGVGSGRLGRGGHPRPESSAPMAPQSEGAARSEAQREPEAKASGRRSAPPAASGSSSYGAYDSYAPSESLDNLGTEYGESRDSQVTEVGFRRAHATRPAALISLRYDDRAGLYARGIEVDPRPRPIVRSYPEAFPHSRFAPPPPPY